MKKIYNLLALLTFIILSAGIISACEGANCQEDTAVKGIIYQDVESNIIAGADVEVTCTHDGVDYTKTTVSNSNGKYVVIFYNESKCDYGDEVTVSAYKSGVGAGTEEGEINKKYTTHYGYYWCSTLNIGIVNVPLVPEFGLIAGMATILGALGVFFVVRKR